MSSTTGTERVLRTGWSVVALLLTIGLCGCGSGEGVTEAEDRPQPALTYICVETGAVEEGPARAWPYQNPKTGRDTFMLHLYSEGVNRWFPVPPTGPGQGNPLATPCPKTGQTMSVVGPKPTPANVSVGRKPK
jgi:hypothetical protein